MPQQQGSPERQEQYMKHLYRGSELLLSNQLEDAKSALEQAMAIDPDDAKGLSLLGLIYYRLADYPRAREIYEKLVARFPKEASLRVNLGLVLMMLNETHAAIAQMQAAVEYDPDHQRAHVYLGHLYAELGDDTKARQEFRRAGQDHMVDQLDSHVDDTTPTPVSSPAIASGDSNLTPRPISVESERSPAPPQPEPPAAQPAPQAAQPKPEPEPQAAQPELEPEPQAAQPEPEPEPQAAQPEPEPEPQAAQPEPEPEPQAAQPEPEPEPQAAQPEPEPEPQAAQPEPEPEPQAAQPEPESEFAEPQPVPPPPAPRFEPEPLPQPPLPEPPQATVPTPPSQAAPPAVQSPGAGLEQEIPQPEPATSAADAKRPSLEPQTVSADSEIPAVPDDVTLPSPTAAEHETLSQKNQQTKHIGSIPIFSFATEDLIDTTQQEGGLRTDRQGNLLVPVNDEVFIRETGMMAHSGALSFRSAAKRTKGQTLDETVEDAGLGTLLLASGQGMVVSSPGEGRFTVLQLFDDFIYLRQEALFAFESSLYWENGRIHNPETEIPLVHLRGEGKLALWSGDQPLKLRVVPDHPLKFPAQFLLGWLGRVIPRFLPHPTASSEPAIPNLICEGEGVLLMRT